MPQAAPFITSRVVKAPRELVYKVHTEAAHMVQWLGGPEAFKSVNYEFKVGGTHHYCQKNPDGSEMWGLQVFREIVPMQKLVCIQSFSDKDGGLTRHPMAPTWPLEMHATTVFEDAPSGASGQAWTKITITWQPYNADDTANATFDGARAGMQGGFGANFDKVEAYLATLV